MLGSPGTDPTPCIDRQNIKIDPHSQLIRNSPFSILHSQFFLLHSSSLKEANETDYWLDLLHQTGYITSDSYDSFFSDAQELIRLLVSIVRTSRETINRK